MYSNIIRVHLYFYYLPIILNPYQYKKSLGNGNP
jgi:hypothetical protein